jgi:hypothetical protein
VPELELELTRGTLGVRFTTVEGLLQLVLADLQQNTVNIANESENKHSALAEFLNRLQKVNLVHFTSRPSIWKKHLRLFWMTHWPIVYFFVLIHFFSMFNRWILMNSL